MASPSKYRRDGRRAFIPGEEPSCEWYDCMHHNWSDFLDGWEEARKEHEAEEAEKEEKEAENWRFNNLREEILHLQADPALNSILTDMVDLMEAIKDGTATS